ncbi:MAG: SRPBCC family protein [Chitinophagales bacterium]
MLSTILLILSGAFALLIIVGIFLPSKISFERNLSINADKKIIFSYLENLKQWETWSAWSTQNDASIIFTFPKKYSGTGAIMQWKGKKLGAGRMEILKSNPNQQLEMQLMFNNSGFRIYYFFTLKDIGGSTHVQWEAIGKMRRIGIAKIIALMLPKWMGRDMEIGLKILKQTAEKK